MEIVFFNTWYPSPAFICETYGRDQYRRIRLSNSSEFLMYQNQAHRGTDEQVMRWVEKQGVS